MQRRLLLLDDPRTGPLFVELVAALQREKLIITRQSLFDIPRQDCDAVLFLLFDPVIDALEIWNRGCALGDWHLRAGRVVLRHPRTLVVGRKSVFVQRLRAAVDRGLLPGVRVARCTSWPLLNEVSYPCILREDDQHTSELFLARDADEAARVVTARFFHRLIALEYIDTRGNDGFYRKYRCFVGGRDVVPLHLQIASTWCVRGQGRVFTSQSIAEEEAFLETPLSADHAQIFVEIAQVLGLETCAFDYALLSTGEVVVWEVNPTPAIPRFVDRRHTRAWPRLRARDMASARAYELWARCLRSAIDSVR